MEILRIINNLVEELNIYGNEKLFVIELNDEELLVTKRDVYQTLIYLSQQEELDYEIIENFIKRIYNLCTTSNEMRNISELKKYVENIKLHKKFDILRYSNKEHLKFIINYNKRIFEEYRHIKQFLNTQNQFDNLLSLIKAIQRLEMQNINIIMDLNFDSETDETFKNANSLLNEGYKSFKNVIFMI